ncbi:autophagy-related protein, putative [Candida dubliniensis CD36]|uniref:Autophagy-related protein n=1 Tax=Candida dubliniensis (strain CD36 / ATCC MYA-646 / CBS 7987 / NCPF 3949 / NRRL Y-17841) TaxID=573826 RepID=B9WLR0_CANDC|nr:autophagy-related protein, putative [Candida dubliniensis CD36]CAX40022.1 autophagy-related protein, putative [Candida dubliniensis CD36]
MKVNHKQISSVSINEAVESSSEIQEGIPNNNNKNDKNQESIWNKKSSFHTWLVLCYSTGPVASMSRTYVPASIQSIARNVGKTRMNQPCGTQGNDCYVKFGFITVHHTSYVLYLRAVSTAIEGIVAIFLMGIADYSNYRKLFLIFSILIYGFLALPFIGLTNNDYQTLVLASILYSLLIIDDSIYQILEGSYIPLFMRADKENPMQRGSVVAVLGLFLGNLGGITALVIGIIISYSSGTPEIKGYHNFLIAITVAGCMTIVLSLFSALYIPNVQGKPRVDSFLVLPFKRFFNLLKDIQKYPMAFLYCISWVIWNVSFNNFMSMFLLLFRSTLGLGNSDAEYTVYTFMSYICSSGGSLLWMLLYQKWNNNIKYWGYAFLSVSLLANFWGCLGINKLTPIGFQNRWEFWVFEVFYSATSSAMRSLNRCIYSSLLPVGNEAQYFGLEVTLGIASGWIGSLVNAVIQDRTNDDRFPFLPNMFLVIVSLILYYYVDLQKGMNDVDNEES